MKQRKCKRSKNPSLLLGEEKKGEERCRRKLGGPGTADNKVLSAGQLFTLRTCITHSLEQFQSTPTANSFLLLRTQHYTSKTILLPSLFLASLGFLTHHLTAENLDGIREAMPLSKARKRLQAAITHFGRLAEICQAIYLYTSSSMEFWILYM